MPDQAFEWDERKNKANIKKHGIAFEEAIGIFDGDILQRPDDRHDYSESRIIATGEVAGREIVVVYTWRGRARRIISSRRAHDTERKAYRQAFPPLDRSG